jgi:hypothetical protein
MRAQPDEACYEERRWRGVPRQLSHRPTTAPPALARSTPICRTVARRLAEQAGAADEALSDLGGSIELEGTPKEVQRAV